MQHGIRKLLLLGAGHAHVHVLAELARHRPADLDVTLLTPFAYQTYSGMTPGFVAGHYTEAECQIPLEPLVLAAGVRWVQGRCTGIDATARRVPWAPAGPPAANATALPYDLLSIDTGAVLDRRRLDVDMPGASTHALIVRPIESFAQRWPQVMDMARNRPLSIAVIGAGAAGLELLFAAEHAVRTRGMPGSRFTLVTGGADVAGNYPPGVQQRVLHQLRRRDVTLLRDSCTGLQAGAVQLGSGATLACDVAILAIGTHAPPWLQGSGLALADTGHILVNAHQQSTSHPEVFAAGDVASRADTPHPKSGVYAVRAGPPLAHNLLAAHHGKPLKPHHPPRHTLNLLSCGPGHAIASWGPLHVEGGWAWRWKDRIDRGFVARYRASPAAMRR